MHHSIRISQKTAVAFLGMRMFDIQGLQHVESPAWQSCQAAARRGMSELRKLLTLWQADSLKRELAERIKQQTVEYQKNGDIVQPRWFSLREPNGLASGIMPGAEQRYRCCLMCFSYIPIFVWVPSASSVLDEQCSAALQIIVSPHSLSIYHVQSGM